MNPKTIRVNVGRGTRYGLKIEASGLIQFPIELFCTNKNIFIYCNTFLLTFSIICTTFINCFNVWEDVKDSLNIDDPFFTLGNLIG